VSARVHTSTPRRATDLDATRCRLQALVGLPPLCQCDFGKLPKLRADMLGQVLSLFGLSEQQVNDAAQRPPKFLGAIC
jgi:hypothetical protein